MSPSGTFNQPYVQSGGCKFSQTSLSNEEMYRSRNLSLLDVMPFNLIDMYMFWRKLLPLSSRIEAADYSDTSVSFYHTIRPHLHVHHHENFKPHLSMANYLVGFLLSRGLRWKDYVKHPFSISFHVAFVNRPVRVPLQLQYVNYLINNALMIPPKLGVRVLFLIVHIHPSLFFHCQYDH
jgi:hypothetical protein